MCVCDHCGVCVCVCVCMQIAALVIVLILALAGLIIAVISLRDARRALALVSYPKPSSSSPLPQSSAVLAPGLAKDNAVFIGCMPLGPRAHKSPPLLPTTSRYAPVRAVWG